MLKMERHENSITTKNGIFRVGELVLASGSGYTIWPGFIKEISGIDDKLEVIVEFFGTRNE